VEARTFRDLHLLPDDHAEPIFAMAEEIAERVGLTPLRSLGRGTELYVLLPRHNSPQIWIRLGPRGGVKELPHRIKNGLSVPLKSN
jgi:hypothetical protein